MIHITAQHARIATRLGLATIAVALIAATGHKISSGAVATQQHGEVTPANTANLSPVEIYTAINDATFWDIDKKAPKNYYDSVDTKSAEALRESLHLIIDNHRVFAYTTKSRPSDHHDGRHPYTVDTWDIISLADEFANDHTKIIDIYKNTTYTKQFAGSHLSNYDREHSWPKSYGFSKRANGKAANVLTNPAYTDCHHLYACDKPYNSGRGNTHFGPAYGLIGSLEYPTTKNLGRGGDTRLPKDSSNWRAGGSTPAGSWQVWKDRRGDIARAMFYMDIRYEGDKYNTPHDTFEADLTLTNTLTDIKVDASTTKAWLSFSVVYFGVKSELLKWHKEDPVDNYELRRNAIVYFFQRNRNPFVDNPDWVDIVYDVD